MHLTLAQRADWLGHLTKALVQQHHREDEPYLRKVVPAEAVVFDVGAHAGQYTKLFGRIAKSGSVFAFEPGAYALSILTKVVRLHRLKNVRIMPLALSDSVGEATFSLPIKKHGGFGFGLAHLARTTTDQMSKASTVRTTTIDAVVRELALTRLDFIKADIEGWELHMLRGAKSTLERFHPTLQLEISDAFLNRAGDSAAEVWRFLQALGYEGARVPNGDHLFSWRASHEIGTPR